VDGFGSGSLRGVDDLPNVEVGIFAWSSADVNSFIGEAHVSRRASASE